MERVIPVKQQDLIKAILMILNTPYNFNLSNMEIDIVSCMLNHNMQIIDLANREIIRMELDKDKFNLNNYIVRLRDKGMVIVKPADKNLYVNPNLYDLIKDNKISFELQVVE